MKKLLYTILLFFCLVIPLQAATYYVKNGGNNGLSGLDDTNAWETIAKVNDFAEATGFASGDIIQFKKGDTWTGDETLGYDGSGITWGTINGLTIQAYGTGANPIFDCNSMQAIFIDSSTISNLTIKDIYLEGMDWTSGYSTNDYHIHVEDVNGLTIDNVDGDGFTNATVYPRHKGFIGITHVDGNIEVKNCDLTNNYKAPMPSAPAGSHTYGSNDAAGIIVWYIKPTGTPKTTGTVSIHNNTISNVYSDSLQMAGMQVASLSIYDNTFSGFGENSIDFKGVANADIYNNSLSHDAFGVSASITSASSGPITVTLSSYDAYWPGYSSVNNKVHDNYIHDSIFSAISTGYSSSNLIYNNYFLDTGRVFDITTDSNKIYNNLINLSGSLSAGFVGTQKSLMRIASAYDVDNLKFYNNTVYISGSDYLYGIGWQALAGQTGNEIKNNIIQMTTNSASVFPLYVQDYDSSNPDSTNIAIDYNNYYNANHANRVSFDGTAYTTVNFSTWQELETPDAHANDLSDDPKFTNPATPNFTLQSDSPCIDTGAILADLYSLGWSPATAMPTVSVNVETLDRNDYLPWCIGVYENGFTISGAYPTSLQPCDNGSSTDNVGVTSSENATCKYSIKGTDACSTTYPNLDTLFDDTTGQTAHIFPSTTNCNAETPYVVKCLDDATESIESNCLEITHSVAAGGGETPQPPPAGECYNINGPVRIYIEGGILEKYGN